MLLFSVVIDWYCLISSECFVLLRLLFALLCCDQSVSGRYFSCIHPTTDSTPNAAAAWALTISAAAASASTACRAAAAELTASGCILSELGLLKGGMSNKCITQSVTSSLLSVAHAQCFPKLTVWPDCSNTLTVSHVSGKWQKYCEEAQMLLWANSKAMWGNAKVQKNDSWGQTPIPAWLRLYRAHVNQSCTMVSKKKKKKQLLKLHFSYILFTLPAAPGRKQNVGRVCNPQSSSLIYTSGDDARWQH